MPIFVCGCLEGLDKMMTTTIAQMNTTGTPPRMGTQQKTADGHAGAKVPASWYCTEAATVEFKHYKYGGKDIASYSCLSCCAVWQRQFDRRSMSSLGSSLGTVELVDDDGKAEDDQKKGKKVSNGKGKNNSDGCADDVLQIWAICPTWRLHESDVDRYTCFDCDASWFRC